MPRPKCLHSKCRYFFSSFVLSPWLSSSGVWKHVVTRNDPGCETTGRYNSFLYKGRQLRKESAGYPCDGDKCRPSSKYFFFNPDIHGNWN